MSGVAFGIVVVDGGGAGVSGEVGEVADGCVGLGVALDIVIGVDDEGLVEEVGFGLLA